MAQTTLTGTSIVNDVYIDSANPTSNLSGEDNLWSGERDDAVATRRSLIKFNLSSIPANSTITGATLRLYANFDASSNTRTMRVYRTLRAWVDTQATWNIYSTGNNWGTAGGFNATDCEQTDIGSVS